MITLNYEQRLQSDVAHWTKSGLIDENVANTLLKDVAGRTQKRSLGTVIAILGAVLVAAAIMTFVAANWEEMSRQLRSIVLLAAMWIAYLLSWFLHKGRHFVLSEAMLVIAIAAFGASIMFIGQMYHLQGRNEDAILVWMIGALITALVARSNIALVFAVGLSVLWFVTGWDWGPSYVPDWSPGISAFYLYPFIWLALAACGYWFKSRIAAHCLLIAIFGWGILWMFETEKFWAFAIGGSLALTLIGAMLFSLSEKQFFQGFEYSVLNYSVAMLAGILMFFVAARASDWSKLEVSLVSGIAPLIAAALTGLMAYQMRDKAKHLERDRLVVPIAALVFTIICTINGGLFSSLSWTAATLAFSIWIIRFGWRLESPTLSRLGYLSFAATLLITYNRLFGSLEMTAAVYLIGGALLIGLAVWLLRREKNSANEGAAS